METNAGSPAGRLLTLESLDYSRQCNQAYDFGAAADHNAELFRGQNNDIDEQSYDFGAAADYNTDLLKRKNSESYELALPAFLNTTLLSTSYAATLVPEPQDYMPIDFNSGDWNELSPAEPNVEVSMTGFIEAGNISKQFSPTPFVNNEKIPGQIATAPLVLPSPQTLSGATDGSHEVPLRGLEGRLSCHHPGCNKSFPRDYERQRHMKNIHLQNFQVVCPVYGCHRTTKPFKRADKFMEHFRKHDSSRSYRCLIENCQSAPFDIPGLIDHLTKSHYAGDDAQPNLEFINKKVLGTRSIPFWLHRLCLSSLDVCPLAPIGCTYRLTADDEDLDHKRVMQQHILTHQLSDRRQGSELLRNFFTGNDRQYLDDGTKNCMLCSFQVNGCFHRELFFNHMVKDHSKEERGSVLEDTYHKVINFLYLWLGQPGWKQLDAIVLSNECREAGFRFGRWQENFLLRLEEC
ncbi:putative transcription factor c2h2 protein [Botrytis fragariae]|uniref:Putative transcription factor c2h2 protein n=1 Tax=Botrytis fragariae TaxID=1964551 RepID=A0A8H6AYB0_9HELO|nr:putative transcription factor c2h2 protein [Botrytis fragariae]KAF5875752.1 putative transcription factor c2h2 protein [Botrytis fragariae]